MTYPRINCDSNYQQSRATRGLDAYYLYLFLPVYIKEPVFACASLWKAAKAPYHIGLGLSASYIHSRKVKTEWPGRHGQGIHGSKARQRNQCSEGAKG